MEQKLTPIDEAALAAASMTPEEFHKWFAQNIVRLKQATINLICDAHYDGANETIQGKSVDEKELEAFGQEILKAAENYCVLNFLHEPTID